MLRPDGPIRKIHVVGAGLVGGLLSIFLARRGFEVELYERRPDMRKESISAGRSINLAVSARGLHALDQVGLKEAILTEAVPMRGRMMHAVNGTLTYQAYGTSDSQCINSISRGGLNKRLLAAAEKTGRVRMHFNQKIDDSRFAPPGELVIGTDGSASVIRQELMARPGATVTEDTLSHGYKELTIPAGPGGAFRLERNALHIWPRGSHMLIALPNIDGSFTCTLFLPFTGPVSFESLATPGPVRAFFESQFGDAHGLIPDLEEAFFANPTGRMVTVKCSPWNHGTRALVMGDAAHAIVPFFGQGMNCGFEDCVVFDELLSKHGDWAAALEEFVASRKPNSDAIADLAVENFIEMRDRVADPRFLLEKAVEKELQLRFPGEYVSRYTLVSFSRVPYRLAYEAGLVQAEILGELCRGITSAAEVNFERAGPLIRARLAPLLKGYV